MTLGDFGSMVDQFETKSPYLTQETFMRSFCTSWKNHDLQEYDFELLFFKIWEVRVALNGSSLTEHDALVESRLRHRVPFSHLPPPADRAESMTARLRRLETLQQQRDSGSGWPVAQMLKLQGMANSKSALGAQLKYFNFIDGVLKCALISANHVPSQFEEALQRLLMELSHISSQQPGSGHHSDSNRNGFPKSKEEEIDRVVQALKFPGGGPDSAGNSQRLKELRFKNSESTAAVKLLNTFSQFYRHIEASPRSPPMQKCVGAWGRLLFRPILEYYSSAGVRVAECLLEFVSCPKSHLTRVQSDSVVQLPEANRAEMQSMDLAVYEHELEMRTRELLWANQNGLLQELYSFVSWPRFLDFVTKLPHLDVFGAILEGGQRSGGRPLKMSTRRKWKPFFEGSRRPGGLV